MTTKRKSGQAIIFLIVTVVILTFMALWNFDLHKLLYVKNVTQNGGDAAALMAARWQGITLNVIGDLNIMQALALASGDSGTVAAISNIQARLLITGPMVALEGSQQAAKNNGIFPNPDFSEFFHEHADTVRNIYASTSPTTGDMICPEPYPGAWQEYAAMLDLIADEGVAAGPDNMQLFFDSINGGHLLFSAGFYDAIAGQNWCWFLRNAPSLLEDYTNFFPCWWPSLPEPPVRQYLNSEFYGLKLTKSQTTLNSFDTTAASLSELASERGFTGAIDTNTMGTTANWYVYDSSAWGDWTAANSTTDGGFPFVAPVRSQYYYSGADAAVRVEGTTGRYTPGTGGSTVSNTMVWTSAAKPFGYLGEERPTLYSLVLPAFHDVRLIPVDTSSGPVTGGINLDFRRHVDDHLPNYMENGPSGLPSSCYYCRQLITWENTAFRQSGIAWLNQNSDQCYRDDDGGGSGGGGGGGSGSGGRRRGH
jgi:hypothetical protein